MMWKTREPSAPTIVVLESLLLRSRRGTSRVGGTLFLARERPGGSTARRGALWTVPLAERLREILHEPVELLLARPLLRELADRVDHRRVMLSAEPAADLWQRAIGQLLA